MEEFDRRLTEVERGLLKMESILETTSDTLKEVHANLKTLTRLQIEMAEDRARGEARESELKSSITRVHERVDKIEAHLTKIVMTIVLSFLGGVMSLVIQHGGT